MRRDQRLDDVVLEKTPHQGISAGVLQILNVIFLRNRKKGIGNIFQIVGKLSAVDEFQDLREGGGIGVVDANTILKFPLPGTVFRSRRRELPKAGV